MSNIKIGLDFGTHQTKVCIVDASDRRNRRYLFHRFIDLEGNEHYTFPSLVQVNTDGTLSYGYIDTDKARMVMDSSRSNATRKPKVPNYKKYDVFAKPTPPKRPAILDEKAPKRENVTNDLSCLLNILQEKKANKGKDFKQRQQEAKAEYETAVRTYEMAMEKYEVALLHNRQEVDEYNSVLQKEYQESMQLYGEAMKEWSKPIPQIYRYFKQTVFSTGMKWNHEESALLISVWYLTYVFFTLDKVYGTQNLVVSMGTSSGVSTWSSNKKKASQIILTVYDLIDNVFKHDMELFMSATIDELKSATHIVEYSDQAKEDNAIFVFPEAIANLQPLAQRKAFAGGLNLLIDIGGGTTDISLFTSPNGEPVQVYDYQSLPFGINSINEHGNKPHFDAVSRAVWEFTNKLERYAYSLHVPQREVKKIANHRNVVFTGGGSANNQLTRAYHGFTDVVRFRERFFHLMPVGNIEQDVREEIHVLSTALGLAMAENDDSSIPMHTYSTLFAQVAEAYADARTINGGERYEHGLTDF